MVQETKIKIDNLIEEIGKVIIGKESVVKLTLAAFFANGHVLYEDIPGTGKTMLVKTLARTTRGRFNRIQFTADLLPNDIIGVSLFNSQKHEFEFKPGPVFADIVLADEINRTTPRTQSALLEAMSEKTVTIDGNTHRLSDDFFVVATQNPVDYQGTYPLPEAQLDRFLVRLNVGYPAFEEEMNLLDGVDRNDLLSLVEAILTQEDVREIKGFVSQVHIESSLLTYALKLVHETRNHKKIKLGISPRGAIGYVQAARALALVEGRNYCTPDDFITLMKPVFGHRILLHSRYAEYDMDVLLDEVRNAVAIPRV